MNDAPARQPRTWLVLQATDSGYYDVEGERYEYPSHISNAQQIAAGDLLVVARTGKEASDGRRIVGLGRVGRIEEVEHGRSAIFDRYLGLTEPASFDDVGGDPRSNKTNSINEVERSLIEVLLPREGIASIDAIPSVQAPRALREVLFGAVSNDLVGPAEGPEEEFAGASVRSRYLVGQLAPKGAVLEPEEYDDGTPAGDDTEEGGPEQETPSGRSLMPSSIGITFAVSGDALELDVIASWGKYSRVKSETYFTEDGNPRRVWKRSALGASQRFELSEGAIGPLSFDDDAPDVTVEGRVRRLGDGDWVLTLFLVNGQEPLDQNQDEAWLFQPELTVEAPDGSSVFRRRPTLEFDSDEGLDAEERKLLAMQYRAQVEFAVGHGVSVHAEADPANPAHATRVSTRILPWYDVPDTETPTEDEFPGLTGLVRDMKELSELEREELVGTLRALPDEYERWIDGEAKRAEAGELAGHEDAAEIALDHCRRALGRIRQGIDVLEDDLDAFEAFRFANRAMWLQRIHTEYALRRRRGAQVELADVDIAENRSWRPFQLAFILVSLATVTEPTHEDRANPTAAVADLLWFPTGGGKTEAYLGLAAYAMGLRRRQGEIGGLEGAAGVTVIMRYTLRLLTIQQFQRATTLVCAMESIRRGAVDDGDASWGAEPFRIGLWVGAKATPNSTKDAERAIVDAHGDSWSGGGIGTPYQLRHCPWCGSALEPGRDLLVDEGLQRTLMYCPNWKEKCEFTKRDAPGEGIPALVVDEEIYRLLPALLIGTVDKFAQMPWNGAVRNLFGRVERRCRRHGFLTPDSEDTGRHPKRGSLPAVEPVDVGQLRPPDLIIQDELHLISGPLGTMVGLYETGVDGLCEWTLDDETVRPKVIASTATIRRARDQVHGLFLRRVEVFPPRGLDIGDNFFARQRPVSPEHPGRRYLGICAPGKSRPAVLIRVYVALLAAAQDLYRRHGKAADPWMSLIGYFNSLRELGGMRRLVEDDVNTRLFRVDREPAVPRPGLSGRQIRNPEELTSRRSSADIPMVLDWLEQSFDPEDDEERERARKEKRPVPRRPIDVLLATNMLSVGVDVQRLGLMAVAGQPKTTAEYIQATSRVGRRHPGLICTVLNWARPRDLSHYERFEQYHATFYQYVEALSVTPFAPGAVARGLTGVLVSLLRLEEELLAPNVGAGDFDRQAEYGDEVVEKIVSRAWSVAGSADVRDDVRNELAERLDEWAAEVDVGGRVLGYQGKRDGSTVPLLRRPSSEDWLTFTVLNSLRDVEPTVNLIKMDEKEKSPPKWARPPKPEDRE